MERKLSWESAMLRLTSKSRSNAVETFVSIKSFVSIVLTFQLILLIVICRPMTTTPVAKNDAKSPVSKTKAPAKFSFRKMAVLANRTENTPEKTNQAGADEHICVSQLVEGNLVAFTVDRENGSGAYAREAFYIKPADLFGQEDLHVVGAFDMYDNKDMRITLTTKSPYSKTAIVCALSEEGGEEPAVAATVPGNAIAAHFQATTTAKKWGDKKPKPITCIYAYMANKTKTKKLNEVIGNNGASKALAILFHDQLEDGSFKSMSSEIIPTYYNECNVDEMTKKIQYLFKKANKSN